MHSHVKYLRKLIDEILSWNKQIESIYKKLARANGILWLLKLCYFVPKNICISVSYLFYTHLIYGYLFWSWSCSRKSNIDRLIKLRKRCINISDFDPHTDPQYSELNLLKVNDIFLLSKLLFMFDFIKENISEDLKRLLIFNKSVHSYETRSSKMFHISKGKTSLFDLTLSVIMVLNYGVSFFTRFCTKKLNWQNVSLKICKKYIS